MTCVRKEAKQQDEKAEREKWNEKNGSDEIEEQNRYVIKAFILGSKEQNWSAEMELMMWKTNLNRWAS